MFDKGDYIFLNTKRKCKEEYEVTDYSIMILSAYYDYLKSYKMYNYRKSRNQMSSSGAWLQPEVNSGKRIDVVADILTSLKLFNDKNQINEIIKEKYCKVYHAIGNIIPIPEGANYGGRSGADNYFLKLDYIQALFKKGINVSEKEIEMVENRLNAGLYLSARAKGENYPAFKDKLILRYWLKKEVGFDSWESYAAKNYLIGNFVDDNYRIREFNYKEIKDEDIEKLTKNIIKRSLLILGEDCANDDVDSIYQNL